MFIIKMKLVSGKHKGVYYFAGHDQSLTKDKAKAKSLTKAQAEKEMGRTRWGGEAVVVEV